MSDTTSGVYRRVTNLGVDTDLVALGGSGQGSRGIRADAAGTLQVKDMKGTTVSLPFAAGETQPIRATTILSAGTSGVTGLTIYY